MHAVILKSSSDRGLTSLRLFGQVKLFFAILLVSIFLASNKSCLLVRPSDVFGLSKLTLQVSCPGKRSLVKGA
jgi:hypothetical protein